MPKAPMNENYLLARRKHKIRVAWKVFTVKPIAIAKAVGY
jgi:hypothetical protein